MAEIVGGTARTVYTRANNELVSLFRPASGDSRTYHADGLGSVRLLSDAGGTVTDRYDYTAFGELIEHTGSDAQPYQFAGEPYDPNLGFYYNRARWLDPTTGRFLGIDPFPGRPQDPATLHPYSYAHQRPTTLRDPTGWVASSAELGAVASVRGELATITAQTLRVIDTLHRVESFFDLLETIHSLISLLSGRGDVKQRLEREIRQLLLDGLELDFGEILQHLAVAMPQIGSRAFFRWSRWLIAGGRTKKIAGYVVYLPSLPGGSGAGYVTPGLPWKGRQIKFVVGGRPGRIMGLGLWMPKIQIKGVGKAQQLWRMDYHEKHDFKKEQDLDVLDSAPYHFHIRKPGHDY